MSGEWLTYRELGVRLGPGGRMKPVNLAAELAAVETELTCLKMVLTQAREDRDELRQERDAWRRVAEKLNACALREADERDLASPERSSWRRRRAGG
jgi:Phage related protein